MKRSTKALLTLAALTLGLGLATGDPIVLTSEIEEFRGRAFIADVAPGTLQGHWPEVMVLIPHGLVDPFGGVPDYNAIVTVRRA